MGINDQRHDPTPQDTTNPLTSTAQDTNCAHVLDTMFTAVFSLNSSAGIALDYGPDDPGSRVPFLAVAGNFSLHHRVQTGSGAHPASCPMGTRGSFSGGKSAGA
jgi:hypothetical protein